MMTLDAVRTLSIERYLDARVALNALDDVGTMSRWCRDDVETMLRWRRDDVEMMPTWRRDDVEMMSVAKWCRWLQTIALDDDSRWCRDIVSCQDIIISTSSLHYREHWERREHSSEPGVCVDILYLCIMLWDVFLWLLVNIISTSSLHRRERWEHRERQQWH